MRAILVDDERSNLENLQTLLQRHCPQVDVVACANDIHEASITINSLQPDLLLLDIQMGEHTGFDLLTLLPNKNFEIIFVTAYDQYGISAVKFSALDYLLKPVDIDELMLAIKKAETKIRDKKQNLQLDFLLNHLKRGESQPSKIALPQQQEIRYVLVNDIIRCMADNTYTYFFLNNGDKVLVSKPLKEYADLLQPHGFIRTHQSHLVNPNFVKSWLKEDGGSLLLHMGTKIPVSKPNRERVKELLNG